MTLWLSVYLMPTVQLSRMSDERNILIVGVTARPLCASAKKAGFKVYSVDMFADVDTKENSVRTLRADFDGVGLDSASLHQCVAELDPSCNMPLIYGGGFEHDPQQLLALTEERSLIGIHPNTISLLQPSEKFFDVLARNCIRVPETRFDRPGTIGTWLSKSLGGSGGLHVEYANRANLRKSELTYFQRHIEGRIITATVNCYEDETEIVGFSEQWCATDCYLGQFVYGGAVSLSESELPQEIVEDMKRAAKTLAAKFKLRGLVSLDGIMTQDRWFLLELNPRPSATFELHEGEDSFIGAHIKAFFDEPTYLRSSTLDGELNAHFVIYAQHDFRVPDGMEWPEWVRDLPAEGETFDPGDPVCTVYAKAGDSARAKTRVQTRHREMTARIKTWN